MLVLPSSMEHLTPAYQAMLERYRSLKFLPLLPELNGVKIELRRFQGWADYLRTMEGQYARLLLVDLDVVFQRNPFAMPLEAGVALHLFAEWHGLKIGQCEVHRTWFNGCAGRRSGVFIPQQVAKSYYIHDRICAGSTFGTVEAMQVYLDLMTESLQASNWKCNDQAMHIHLYYSGLLHEKLAQAGLGSARLVPNAEALLGTVGTTPVVRINEWGEILNERGQVQHIVHQFKRHDKLSEIVRQRYGWISPPGQPNTAFKVPELVESGVKPVRGWYHQFTSQQAPTEDKAELKQYILPMVSKATCNPLKQLCSCRYPDCQWHYE